jgi:transposase-like protein
MSWKQKALELNGTMSWRKIGELLGISKSTVSDYLRSVVGPAKPVQHSAKILTLDIETSPIVANVWGLWKQNVGLNQIICDWSILSFTAKWLHEPNALYQDCRGQGASVAGQDLGVRNDSHLLFTLRDLLDEADIVVTQNGVSFDNPKIMSRFMIADILPPSPFRNIDTMLEAKKIARFTSNRLAWLSEVLTDTPKDEHKQFPGFELWTECLKDNPAAWEEMEKYNVQDVFATEAVYLKLRPYIQNHPNVAAYDADDSTRCPKCGSADLEKRGERRTNAGLYQQYLCKSCGGYSSYRYTQNTLAKRKSLLGN